MNADERGKDQEIVIRKSKIVNDKGHGFTLINTVEVRHGFTQVYTVDILFLCDLCALCG